MNTALSLDYANRAFALRVIASDHEVTSKENRRSLILAARTYERLAKMSYEAERIADRYFYAPRLCELYLELANVVPPRELEGVLKWQHYSECSGTGESLVRDGPWTTARPDPKETPE